MHFFHKSLKLIILCQLYLVRLNLLGYFLVGAEEMGRHGGNIGYDLVGLKRYMWLLLGGRGWLRVCWLRVGRLRLCMVTNLLGFEVT